MLTRTAMLTVLAALSLGASPAWAGKVLATAAIQGAQGDAVSCSVANAGDRELRVHVEVVNTGGVDTLEFQSMLVLPRGTNRIQQTLDANASNRAVYCRFTPVSGSARSIRASLCLRPGGGERCELSIDAR